MKHASCWFDYKTVIVTGASAGIGKGLVKKLINDHCCRVIGIARNKEKMQQLIQELGDKEIYFTYMLFDVSKQENWEQLAEQLKQQGIQPDLLINNAGILPKFDKFLNYTMEDINRAMQVNFYSCVYSMRALLPLLMQSPNGGVVNIASSAALCSMAGASIYSASKAALKSLTESVREECRGHCYVGLVCPGYTNTDIFTNQSEKDESVLKERMLELVSSSCDHMVENIVNGIWKKRSNMVFGLDARAIHNAGKVFGSAVPWLNTKVLRAAHLQMFGDVFEEDETLPAGEPLRDMIRRKITDYLPLGRR